MSLELARTVADAVLYEGYLLYPYRATSSKNHSRWQWGVLGPPGAAAAGLGEESSMSTQCLVRGGVDAEVTVRLRLRFLQLQTRVVERVDPHDPAHFEPVSELSAGALTWMSWDEAVPHEIDLDPLRLVDLHGGRDFPVRMGAGEDVEVLQDEAGFVVGRIVRRRWPLEAVLHLNTTPIDGLVRLSIVVDNCASGTTIDKEQAIRSSFIGAHLLLAADQGGFVSLLEPPDDALAAAATCQQSRCWPVLTGQPGETDVLLVSPIILYDYPEIAEQSAGALFDSTEIDEILTLRVMTLTDEEKAAARATDPRAAEIIDRCDSMSPESMQALHGILRDPHAGMEAGLEQDLLREFGPSRPPPDMDAVPTFTEFPAATDEPSDVEAPTYTYEAGTGDIRNVDPPTFDTAGAPWWDPAEDSSVQPDVDTVLIDGVLVGKDSVVRLRPSRRADAQDLFFAGQTARVTAVLSDVDGQIHVAVVLVDDPAADLHEWYGRFLYFAPEELEPLGHGTQKTPDHREESRS